jgi:hypothetical protein
LLKGGEKKLTGNNVAGVQGIFVLDETKAAHQLNLCDLAGAMGAKMFFDILFVHWKERSTRRGAPLKRQLLVA